MLREAIANGTPLGKQADPLMERGKLVPDDLLVALIRERIGREDCARGFILDGFPRTLAQAEGLADMGLGEDASSWFVFEVEVPREELLRRLSGRRWCPRCQATYHVTSNPPREEGICDLDGTALVQREDDKEAVVARRLREYDQQTAPLVTYYRDRADVRRVDGNRPMAAVFEDLKAAVEIPA
jgi:adenylate kinase